MEDLNAPEPATPDPKKHKPAHPKVIVIRDWKEYLGESALIIFSVFLALILTEVINNAHEKNETELMLKDIRSELIQNKNAEEAYLAYHMSVLKNIDSALNDPQFQQQIVSGGEFHLNAIAPHGISYPYLNDVAWQIAKQHNIASKINLDVISLCLLYTSPSPRDS